MSISDLSDEALMLKAQQGELDAIGVLYQRYSKKLFNFFIKLTANRDSSADLMQNVFLRVIKYLTRWLCDIYHMVISYISVEV